MSLQFTRARKPSISTLSSKTSSKAFFGGALIEIAPDLLAEFLVFDTESWKMPLKYPRFAAKKMFDAKMKCEAIFEKYLALPEAQRKDAVWLTRHIEESIGALGVSKEQVGKMHFVLYRL